MTYILKKGDLVELFLYEDRFLELTQPQSIFDLPITFDVLYEDDLEQFLSKTNSDLTADEVREIIDSVRLVGSESEFSTLHKVYGWMVNGIQFVPQNGLARMIALIDFDHPENNIFRAVNQFAVEYTNNGQKETRRPDI